ncbi:MAG: 3-phosphoshikimate 1-carboxyvinyltransferase [Oscillospiraceae bacterium]|nr:3-phosphoshikimate 1-carboxyvinyltransferase [Oscillospiraceae bacterium]
MDITITPQKLSGTACAIPSKSQAHRLLICSAFADKPTDLICPHTNQDIEATAQCLRALGAEIHRTANGYHITPVSSIPVSAHLDCRESGSTLRFMLPIAGALGVNATFQMAGRLAARPLSPLWEEMERMGCTLSRPTSDTISCVGKLKAGNYSIDGGISSQFITGLLFAMALIPGDSTLTVTGKMESAPYIQMTRQALSVFGVSAADNRISGSLPFRSPGKISVEGDWSNAAFFLAASAMGSNLTVNGLCSDSEQGDRAVAEILKSMSEHITVSAADIPDLVPILSVVAASKHGAVFTNIQRLRLKESDRVASVIAMLKALDIRSEATEDTLTVYPGQIQGGVVNSVNDHRIAMSAAIAATVANGPVTILGAQCVAKSYPSFWEEYGKLGGKYEQYLR